MVHYFSRGFLLLSSLLYTTTTTAFTITTTTTTATTTTVAAAVWSCIWCVQIKGSHIYEPKQLPAIFSHLTNINPPPQKALNRTWQP